MTKLTEFQYQAILVALNYAEERAFGCNSMEWTTKILVAKAFLVLLRPQPGAAFDAKIQQRYSHHQHLQDLQAQKSQLSEASEVSEAAKILTTGVPANAQRHECGQSLPISPTSGQINNNSGKDRSSEDWPEPANRKENTPTAEEITTALAAAEDLQLQLQQELSARLDDYNRYGVWR